MTQEEKQLLLTDLSNIKESLNGLRKLLTGDELTGMERLEKLQPSLPSNLDEAAHSYSESDEPLYSPGHRFYWDKESLFGKQIETTFKAGAEWMAGQGETADGTFHHSCGYPSVIELKTYLKDYEGADVIVTIRKK